MCHLESRPVALSLDLLRPFKGLARDTRRKLRFAGIMLDCVRGFGERLFGVSSIEVLAGAKLGALVVPEIVWHRGFRRRVESEVFLRRK